MWHRTGSLYETMDKTMVSFFERGRSFHTIVDVTDSGKTWRSGDTLTFQTRYAHMLYAFTGNHVDVVYQYDRKEE